jgi:hypothetical protein
MRGAGQSRKGATVPQSSALSGVLGGESRRDADVYFEGPITGAKLSGSVKGIDHVHIRADGRFQLHIHAEITTDDGKKIALFADGVALGAPPVLQLRESATMTTSHPEYSWVNTLQVWAPGTVNLATGEIRVKGYAV